MANGRDTPSFDDASRTALTAVADGDTIRTLFAPESASNAVVPPEAKAIAPYRWRVARVEVPPEAGSS